MVIDTSAVIALLMGESAAAKLEAALESDTVRLMSAASFVETAIVVEARYGEPGGRDLDLFIHKAQIQVTAVNAEQAEIARDAYRRFGKGRHRAGLNFGDCFAYALSKATGEPLLFTGTDFSQTDVTPALTGN